MVTVPIIQEGGGLVEISHGTKDELTHLPLRKTHRGGGIQQSSWG